MSMYTSTSLSYNTRKVTNVIHISVKIILLPLLRGNATIVSHYIQVCHDCTTVVHTVNSVKCRVGATMVTRTGPLLGKKI